MNDESKNMAQVRIDREEVEIKSKKKLFKNQDTTPRITYKFFYYDGYYYWLCSVRAMAHGTQGMFSFVTHDHADMKIARSCGRHRRR